MNVSIFHEDDSKIIPSNLIDSNEFTVHKQTHFKCQSNVGNPYSAEDTKGKEHADRAKKDEIIVKWVVWGSI